MARNGSGTYSLPAGNPVVSGTSISSTVHNTTLSDIATALTASIAKDGQTTPTANLPMGTYKHTGVAVASALTDYARADQVQNDALTLLTSVSGTDTITASASITPAAYAAGQTFRFVSAGANTGAATLNVSSLGAKAITKNGATALVAGDIPSGAAVTVVYDGTQFQLVAISGNVGTAVGTSLTTSGSILVNGASGLIGYNTGAGGTVTQATSKTTDVTLNKPCGQVTMNNAALAAGATAVFGINNTTVALTDTAIVNHREAQANYSVRGRCAAGQIVVAIKNETAGSLSDAVVVNFSVIKGASA
jgi:hypothetical protein